MHGAYDVKEGTNFEEICFENVVGFVCVGMSFIGGVFMYRMMNHEPQDSFKDGEFLDQLQTVEVLKSILMFVLCYWEFVWQNTFDKGTYTRIYIRNFY